MQRSRSQRVGGRTIRFSRWVLGRVSAATSAAVAIAIAVAVLTSESHAAEANSANDSELTLRQMLFATVKVVHPRSTATGFILTVPAPVSESVSAGDGATSTPPAATAAAPQPVVRRWLVTAAHVLEPMDTDQCTLVCHRRDASGVWQPVEVSVALKREGQNLWTKHPSADVAVLPVEVPGDVEIPVIGLDAVSSDDLLQYLDLLPGTEILCFGFPHAGIFEPTKERFAIVRHGCLSSYPAAPASEQPTVLCSFNTFEGDSGGAIVVERPVEQNSHLIHPVAGTDSRVAETGPRSSRWMILGLVQGQHFVNEGYSLVYQQGTYRLRLGLSLVVPGQLIRETFEHAQRSASALKPANAPAAP